MQTIKNLFRNPVVLVALFLVSIASSLLAGVNDERYDYLGGYFQVMWHLVKNGNVFAWIGLITTLYFFVSLLYSFAVYVLQKKQSKEYTNHKEIDEQNFRSF